MHVTTVVNEVLANAVNHVRRATLPRILIVAASPRFVGGQSVMAQQLIADLANDDVDVEFLPVDPDLPRAIRFLERVKYVRTLTRTILYVYALVKRVPRYDVVHVFSASYSPFLLLPTPTIPVSRMFRKLVILNYHSGEAESVPLGIFGHVMVEASCCTAPRLWNRFRLMTEITLRKTRVHSKVVDRCQIEISEDGR